MSKVFIYTYNNKFKVNIQMIWVWYVFVLCNLNISLIGEIIPVNMCSVAHNSVKKIVVVEVTTYEGLKSDKLWNNKVH